VASPPPSLPDALLGHAARDPEEPWLFQAEGWDWRWRPWGDLARWMREEAEKLSSLAAGTRIPFLYDGQMEAVIRDLAIQAAGLVSSPSRALTPWPPLPTPPSLPHRERGDVAGAVVDEVEVSAVELVGMGRQIGAQIQPSEKREIVVLGGPLEEGAERAMLSWATVTGAAVVLEPNAGSRVATAAWVRPTVFHGSPAEIAGLRAWAEKEKKKKLPFRRLRTILVTGAEGLAAEEAAFWKERGVRVLPHSGVNRGI
jgi:hypothetical protein